MTIRERVNMLVKPAILKKKFKDVDATDWLSLTQAFQILLDKLSVEENTASIKDNPAKLMFDVLAKKNAEVMTVLSESDIVINEQGKEIIDTLTKFMDKGVTYVQNLNSLKNMAKDQDYKPQEEEKDDDKDFFSPEKFANQ